MDVTITITLKGVKYTIDPISMRVTARGRLDDNTRFTAVATINQRQLDQLLGCVGLKRINA